MGRFETTAETYARHREPYPRAFLAAVSEALKLAGREALIDLGTGPGVLALGFARYVGRICRDRSRAGDGRRGAAIRG